MRIIKSFNKIYLKAAMMSIILCSCNFDLSQRGDSQVLFKLKSPNQTNLIFYNKIIETNELSVLGYNNMYMGGGISVGDINNDELPDIFLTVDWDFWV